MAKIKAQKYFKPTINIDGAEVVIHIKRMSAEEWENFHAHFVKYGFHESQRGAVDAAPVRDLAMEAEARVWMNQVLQDYVSVPVGEVDDEDDHPVVDGAGLLRVFGSRMDVIPQVVGLMWIENRLPESRKNVLRSRVASFVGSVTKHPQTDTGDAPAPVAEPAENKDSVNSGIVTGPSPNVSSGTTDLSD